ncbi:MAG TPA: hypothetical protein PLY87_19595 [Planctomycetaceae bacterium]|nr:hypothetical protein [Planctomycetaceae bacterium]HQZ67308.1 hypothetical protein [Planctomycetaceae bacterium]
MIRQAQRHNVVAGIFMIGGLLLNSGSRTKESAIGESRHYGTGGFCGDSILVSKSAIISARVSG